MTLIAPPSWLGRLRISSNVGTSSSTASSSGWRRSRLAATRSAAYAAPASGRADAGGEPERLDRAARHQRYLRGARGPMPQTISYGDRAEPLGPLLRGHLGVALAPDEHDLVADLDRVVADVDHQLVHRHRARDRSTAPADEDLAADRGEVARHAVGVPDRHRRDPRRRVRAGSAGRRRGERPAASVFTCETRALSESAGRSAARSARAPGTGGMP